MFYSKNYLFSVYWSVVTGPSIGPRRRPSKCQALTGSHPSGWGLLQLENRGSRPVENADYSCRKLSFHRHPNFGQIVAICVKQNLNTVILSVHQSSPCCAVLCMWLISMSSTKASGHHSGPDKLGCGLYGIFDAVVAFSLLTEAELLRGNNQILCSDTVVLFSLKKNKDKT